MEIQWLRNSTFLIKTSLGKRILLDPFDILHIFNKTFLADIICLSKNLDSTYFSFINNSYSKVILPNDNFSNKYIKIKSYKSFSDKLYGLKRGENFITTMEIEGFKLCHLGYLGEIPNKEILNIIQDMDFVFLPIGGNICLSGAEASKLCKLLNSKYIIPMCYKCSSDDFYYSSSKDFLISTDSEIIINEGNILDTDNLYSNKRNTILMFNIIKSLSIK